MSHRKTTLIFLGILSVTLMIAVYLIASPPVPQNSTTSTQPKITWSATSTEVILSPEESTSRDFTFASSLDLQNTAIEAVPEIAGFLRIQPNTFASIPSGQADPVNISFSVPVGTALGMYEGTIHVRVGSTTLPQTLKVIINVWKGGQLSSNGMVVSFDYPPDWTLSSTGTAGADLLSPSSSAALSGGDLEIPPDLTIKVISNPSSLSLADFLASYRGGWFSVYQQMTTTTINRSQAIVVSDSSASVPSMPELAAFLSGGSSGVVLVTARASSQEQFNSIVASVTLH